MKKKLFNSIGLLIGGLNDQQRKRLILITSLILISVILEALGISLVIPLVSIIYDPNYFSKNNFLPTFFSNERQINIIFYLIFFLSLFFIVKNK